MIVGSLKTAPKSNGTGIILATTNNTESRNELLDIDICTQHNQIHNEMTESTAGQEHHQNNKLDTPPMKEGCIKKKLRGRKRESENLRQTRSRAKKKGNK